MKKIMSILALVLLVIPFTSVSAITGNYYVYSVGDEVNFYTSSNDTTGQSTIILKDEGAGSQYVRALALTAYSGNVFYDAKVDAGKAKVTEYQFFKEHISMINSTAEGWPYVRDLATTMDYISLDELKTVFGATSTDGGTTYTIDAAKWGAKLNIVVTSKKGFYTSTVEGENVWVVEFTYDNPTDLANRNITAITVKKVPRTDNTDYAALPVAYFDKTYDCVDRQTKEDYACYQCGEEYTWTKVGTQASTCTLVENVTSKNSCVVSPKTGIADYAIELISLAAVCGLALVLVNRKDLFKQI